MTTQNPGSSNGPTLEVTPVPMLRFREALARVRPGAMALDSSDLAPVSLDIPAAIASGEVLEALNEFFSDDAIFQEGYLWPCSARRHYGLRTAERSRGPSTRGSSRGAA